MSVRLRKAICEIVSMQEAHIGEIVIDASVINMGRIKLIAREMDLSGGKIKSGDPVHSPDSEINNVNDTARRR